MVVDGHLREQVTLGRNVGEPEAGDPVRPSPRDGRAVEAHRRRVTSEQPADGPEQRRLAGAVGADHGHDLALGDGQRRAVDDVLAEVAGREVSDLQHRRPSAAPR